MGELLEFTSATEFDSATISFAIDQSKLGDTAFDNLMILWYNEEEGILYTKNIENKVYLHSCNGGTLIKLFAPGGVSYETSAAHFIAQTCPNTPIVALQDDLVDFFRITLYPEDAELIEYVLLLPLLPSINIISNIHNYLFIYYPVMHYNKGRWITVIFDAESQTIHEGDIGEKWML
ncbi:MAG: hypothetical protein E7503_05785 [Ruminococcus sp.]|nr:hypothetical protein [Ruminococcus sp.]